jgi:hypothetical protein
MGRMRRWKISCIEFAKQVREAILSWGRNNIKPRNVAAIALLFTASAAAADMLIVRSMGPSAKTFPPGKRLPEKNRITLKANDQLVVLDGRGTHTLRGPGSFAPVAAPASGRGGSAPCSSRRQAITAAVRGEPPPTYWDIDVSKSTTICVADRNSLALWREDSSGPANLTITRIKDKRTRRLDWNAGEATLKWPSQLPVAEGADFRLEWTGSRAPTILRFKLLPKKPYELDDVATALIANGCTAQLDLLIRREQENEGKQPSG